MLVLERLVALLTRHREIVRIGAVASGIQVARIALQTIVLASVLQDAVVALFGEPIELAIILARATLAARGHALLLRTVGEQIVHKLRLVL